MNYKETLNLPQTGFPMKAGLVEREPQRLEQWYAEDLHARIRERHAQAKETFVLHDGPPLPTAMCTSARRSTRFSRMPS